MTQNALINLLAHYTLYVDYKEVSSSSSAPTTAPSSFSSLADCLPAPSPDHTFSTCPCSTCFSSSSSS